MNPLDQDVDDDAPTLEYRVPARALVGPTASLPDVLNSREAATALRMGVKELRQLIERGELPAARLGPRRVIRIAKSAIVSLLRGEPQWRLEHLPIMPTDWKLAVTTPDLLKTIKSLLPRASVVVNAGDPDRDGQLLVDEVLVYLHYRGQVDRVLVSDMNPAAVRKALGAIQPNSKFKPLYDAAVGRQRADWLYGLNMTRLYTVLGRSGGYDGVLSVGRVQTPLLGLIVRRDLEIEKFVPKPYFSILADVAGAAQPFTAVWRPGADADSVLDPERRLLSADFASLVERRTSGQPGTVTKASRERKAEAAPLPYSLADLQIDAGRRLGLGPKVVLDVCQALYETHRLTTYPRSDCRYIPEAHLAQASAIVPGIAGVEPKLADIAGAADISLRSRAWNDAKVTAHHALIPTPRTRTAQPLSKNERAIYGLIARRYLAQFFPPFEYFQLDAEITVAGQRFTAKGRLPIANGWKRVLDPSAERDDHAGEDDSRSAEDDVDPEAPLPPLQPGRTIRIARTQTAAKKTSPPRRFTAAALVQAMTGIARYVSNPQIKALLRETDGIGTPATQASIIQTLFERHFIEEQRRQIVSTGTGRALIRALPDVATQPDMTALWEASLRKISEGQAPLEGFLDAVRRQLGELVERARCFGAIQLPGIETRPCTAPGCAGVLRVRVGKAGRFWACSRYPDCTHTEHAQSNGGVVRGDAGKGSRGPRRNRNRQRRRDRREPTSAE